MPDWRGEENPRVGACQLDIPQEGTGLRAHVLDKGVYEKCARSAHPQSTESPRSNGIVGCDAQRDCLGPLASSELSCFAWPVW